MPTTAEPCLCATPRGQRKPRAAEHGVQIASRNDPWVAEVTALVDPLAWPAATRLIPLTERPHPARSCASPTRRDANHRLPHQHSTGRIRPPTRRLEIADQRRRTARPGVDLPLSCRKP